MPVLNFAKVYRNGSHFLQPWGPLSPTTAFPIGEMTSNQHQIVNGDKKGEDSWRLLLHRSLLTSLFYKSEIKFMLLAKDTEQKEKQLEKGIDLQAFLSLRCLYKDGYNICTKLVNITKNIYKIKYKTYHFADFTFILHFHGTFNPSDPQSGGVQLCQHPDMPALRCAGGEIWRRQYFAGAQMLPHREATAPKCARA